MTPRLVTAGESHGPALVVIVDGFPAGIPFGETELEAELARRQVGYGRGPRAARTSELPRILAGVHGGVTTGAPVAVELANPEPPPGPSAGPFGPSAAPSSPPAGPSGPSAASAGRSGPTSPSASVRPCVPRPGHADLALAAKLGTPDFWPAAERASARETAARVAGATLARAFLRRLGVTIGSHVTSLGGVASPVRPEDAAAFERAFRAAEADPVRAADPGASRLMVLAIDKAAADGDTLGGTFEVAALGYPAGLGHFAQWDRRLDARLASAVMSIPGVKGVEIGLGFESADLRGSQVHDLIVPADVRLGSSVATRPGTSAGPRPSAFVPPASILGASRPTNHAGGVEGGLSNGQPVVVRAAMKPIPTLAHPLSSVDLVRRQPSPAPRVRGDVTAVPSASVVAEAMLAWVLAEAALERYGADTLEGVLAAFGRDRGAP